MVRYTIRSEPFIIKCSSAAFSSLYGFCFHFKVEFPSKIKLQMKGKSNYVDIADFSSILFAPSLAFPFPILISLTVRSWRSCFLMKAAFCSWAVPIIITITFPGKRNVIKKISECLTGYNLLFFSYSIIDLFGLQPLNQRYPDIVPTISWQCSKSVALMRHTASHRSWSPNNTTSCYKQSRTWAFKATFWWAFSIEAFNQMKWFSTDIYLCFHQWAVVYL